MDYHWLCRGDVEVLAAIQARYSCRAYQPRPIEQDKLTRLLEAARLAPSARNLQDWRFVIVTAQQAKHALAQAANNQMFIADAGAIIVACSVSRHVMRCGQAVGPIDVAIALEHICLEATELGLATCWIGSFWPDKVRPIVGIPEDVQIIELLAVGYPADQPKPKQRLDLRQIACLERWSFKPGKT
ncbi:MAG: nitroreductase family protein [Sedimentisphaerales bacterium]|nr:nitroreductase family protein [Sedimentisphaerales bacterium]